VEAYGLTETSPGACINPWCGREYNGFAGLPISSTVITIRDDDARPAARRDGRDLHRRPAGDEGLLEPPDETAKVMTPTAPSAPATSAS
jgi:long-chain acyl-CoA synthetase